MSTRKGEPMADFDLTAVMHATFLLTAHMAGPPLLTALGVGVAVSLLQAVTQINESTLAFVPKAAALVAVFALTGASMVTALLDYSHLLFDRLIAIGGA
jgi:flagellar biosynthetic protein FliQ